MPPSTARLQANTAGFSEQDQSAERGLPTTFLRPSATPIGQYTCFFDDCSSRHTHTTRPKLVGFHALWGMSSLAVSSRRATRRRSHLSRLAGGVVARCHPSPANPTTRSSDLGREIPVPISCSAPDLHRQSSRFHKNFLFLVSQKRDRMRWPVFAIVLDVICDSRGRVTQPILRSMRTQANVIHGSVFDRQLGSPGCLL